MFSYCAVQLLGAIPRFFNLVSKFKRNQSFMAQIPRLFYHFKRNPTKWSNTLKQFVSNLPTNYLSVFDHFVKLVFKGLYLVAMVRRIVTC